MKPRRPGRDVALGLAVAGCLLTAAECAARLYERWVPPLAVDHGLGFTAESRLFSPEPGGDLRTRPEKRGVFVDQRLTAEKQPGTLRVAMLGGSSVHFLAPELSALERRLSEHGARVEIINAGGRSYGSHRLVPLLRELLALDLDAVVIYSGHNEFEEIEQLDLANVPTAPLLDVVEHLALFRVPRDALARRQVKALERAHNARILSEAEVPFARAWKHPFTDADVEIRMAAFQENLTLMIEMASERGLPVLLGTVPSNLLRPYLPESAALRHREEVREALAHGRAREALEAARRILRETPGRHQSSDLENEIIRRLAQRPGVTLFDVEAAVRAAEPRGFPGMALFTDHCHLNAKGNQVWAATLEPALRSALQRRASAAGAR